MLVEIVDAAPALRKRFGEHPMGQLIYAADGYMSALIASRARPMFSEPERERGTVSDADIRAAFDGFLAYCGSWELDTGQQIVAHHLTASSIPAGSGNTLGRHYQFVNGLLHLRPLDGAGTLVGERVAEGQ